MDPTIRHRFLGIPSFSSLSSSADAAAVNGSGDELNEDDILWTNDITDNTTTITTTSNNSNNHHHTNNNRPATTFPKNSGILAALPAESNYHHHNSVLYRKPSLASSSSKTIPSIPRPPAEREQYASQSVPARKGNRSAPIKVPVMSMVVAKERNSKFVDEDGYGDDGNRDEEMLPPHEIVARESWRRSPKTAFSVLEGVGRTLKGRDLRQVRNAVWRQTGFLD